MQTLNFDLVSQDVLFSVDSGFFVSKVNGKHFEESVLNLQISLKEIQMNKAGEIKYVW